ncbi:hypothetical protein V5O48_005482 [Marasmius crinis-equi]|uniref:Transmembrane protein n=1 Tax=Marasmius crinis-equi TaxID=585013 RepID=A0ABR3FM75_9AGAR
MSTATTTFSIPAVPQPAATLPETGPATSMVRNPTDGFFGYTFSSSVTDSRHDSRRISSDVDLELGLADIPPPAYDEPPEYTTKSVEPVTLAKYLFKFGFLFPPFWIMGALILLTPLRDANSDPSSPNAWLPEKTEAERAAIITRLRKVELVWAWRCLFALLILVCISIAAGFTIWAVLKK